MESVNENSPSEGFAETDYQPVLLLSPTPSNPPWNTLVAVLVWIASVVLIALIPMLFLMPYIISQGPSFSERQALAEFLKNDTTSLLLQIVAIIPAHVLTLALSWAVVTKLNKFSFRETLGWKSGGMRWPHYIGILVIFFAVAMVVGNYFPEQENELTRILQSSRWAVFLIAFMATFTAPIVEEVIYRGILYSA
ncbi:MAG: hypothetical protein ABJB34_01835, partial [Acidobacteriota bacterium]